MAADGVFIISTATKIVLPCVVKHREIIEGYLEKIHVTYFRMVFN
jgi:hypothetical protein